MAINLSARQFGDKGFLDMVTRVLAETGLDPACLELEITESQVMRQTEGMIHAAQPALRDGRAARDRRLRHRLLEPVVPEAPADPEAEDRPVVRARHHRRPERHRDRGGDHQHGASLDLETIAEGVETAGQLALLRSKGCRVGQGYYFSRPVRAEALYPLLRQNNLYLQSAGALGQQQEDRRAACRSPARRARHPSTVSIADPFARRR